MPNVMPTVVSTEVEGILAAVSDLLIKRVKKNKRQRRGVIIVPNVPASFAEVFDFWVTEGLWREVRRPGSTAHQFWSFQPEAADRLCQFDNVYKEVLPAEATVHRGRRGDPQAPYRKAAGSSMVSKNGDVCTILPPLFASFNKHRVGDSGQVWRYSLSLWFSVGVVSSVGPVDPTVNDSDGEDEAEALAV